MEKMTPFETDSIYPGKDITEMINKFNIDFNSVIKYTLILGSFQDTYNENKKLNSFLISSMSELRKMFDVIIAAKKQKYVHRNEKIEYMYKIHPYYLKILEISDKVLKIFQEIKDKNENIFRQKFFSKSYNLLKMKRSINNLIFKWINDIKYLKEESYYDIKEICTPIKRYFNPTISKLKMQKKRNIFEILSSSPFEKNKRKFMILISFAMILFVTLIFNGTRQNK